LPWLGGKIASIRVGNQELMQAPLAPYAARTRTIAFDESDASGWDECMPSVAACTVQTEAGAASIPDHGDLWRVEWQPWVASDNAATFQGECISLPLRLERAVTLSSTNNGCLLKLNYTATNFGDYPVPWSWAAHPLFAVTPGDRIVLPGSIREVRVEGSNGERLGRSGDRVTWPMMKLKDGSQTNLAVIQPPEAQIGEKLFAGPLADGENWCELHRPQAGIKLRVSFDAQATPYLGLWICSGGWPDRPGPKQMCVAMEPATAPVDSLAETGPWSRQLEPGEAFSWPMDVQIENI
jgi:galactose mutarotase-like enzyme